jgi:hypothetical protein
MIISCAFGSAGNFALLWAQPAIAAVRRPATPKMQHDVAVTNFPGLPAPPDADAVQQVSDHELGRPRQSIRPTIGPLLDEWAGHGSSRNHVDLRVALP